MSGDAQPARTAPDAQPTRTAPDAPYALARFRDGGLGVVSGERILPIEPAQLGAASLNDFLGAGDLSPVARLAKTDGEWRPLADAELGAPVEPRQVLQAGANYRSHVIQLIMAGLGANGRDVDPAEARAGAEKAMDARAASGRAFVFLGLPACVVGDADPLVLPAYSQEHDWELELAAVIGREAFRVSPEEALAHVAGYTIVNDISTRDLLFPPDAGGLGADWYRGKNAPGFLPTGPFLVPAEFVDPTNVQVQLELNGELMQDANTSDLVFGVAKIVSDASQTAPLLPGDIVLTGSPAGNGQHWGRFLRDGDVMTGRISGLGAQVVRCVAEPAVEA